MKKLDTIDVQFRYDEEDGEHAILVLNGVELRQAFDVFNFVASCGLPHVTVEILTCSCGNAGCAGIFEGTEVKTRRYTVEWRDIDSGLPKRFYAFNRVMYDTVAIKTVERMQALAEERENLESEEYDFSGQLDYSRVADLKDSIELMRNWIVKYRSK